MAQKSVKSSTPKGVKKPTPKQTSLPTATPPEQAGAPVVVPTTDASGLGRRSAQHPLVDEARRLAAAGQAKEAADALEKLANTQTGLGRAQLLVNAAGLVRQIDRKRALALAEAATQAKPDHAKGWMMLSFVRDEARDRKGALAAARQALALKQTPADMVDIGRHISRLGDDALALQAVRRGYEASKNALALASFTLRVAVQCADWELADRITVQLRTEHEAGRTEQAAETPRTHLLWCDDQATNVKVVSAFARKLYAEQPPLVSQAWPDPAPPKGKPRRKLRVGYLSYDYRDHATALLIMGMMRYHDREQFEFFAYCTSWDDNSALRRDLLSRFTAARTFAQSSDRKAAEQIKADRIDVLVDLGGLTEGTRNGILAWRPAPVQIAYLGYPGSSGGRYVDYIVADDYTLPAGQELHFPEKIIRIPPTYQINDYAARWLPPAPKRASAGLPAGVQVLGMFNNVNKVTSTVWATWMQILQRAPKSILWMLDPGEVARLNLTRAAEAAGVGAGRILFATRARQEAHIARLQLCDVILDPWPYGGHTTTGDALFAGVPVVSLEGCNFASRVSGGLLLAAGLQSLVRPSVEDYIDTVIDLLNQPDEIVKIRRHLHSRRTRLPVFDADTRTRQLEAAYRSVHERRLANQPAQHLRVGVSAPARAKPAPAAEPVPVGARVRALEPSSVEAANI